MVGGLGISSSFLSPGPDFLALGGYWESEEGKRVLAPNARSWAVRSAYAGLANVNRAALWHARMSHTLSSTAGAATKMEGATGATSPSHSSHCHASVRSRVLLWTPRRPSPPPVKGVVWG